MDNEGLMHELIVERMRSKFSKEYREIKINPGGGPDIVLADHGLTVALVEVETDRGITAERASKWTEMAGTGTKLILMVPRHAKVRTTELLWKEGIADKVGVGSYEITITMP